MANKPKTAQKADTTTVSQMDVCQTPPHALEPLYPYIPKEWVIWESACGPEQLLVTALQDHGYYVVGSDLLMGAEYNRFTYKPIAYDIEITNCPFSIKYQWFEQAFKDGKPFAILAPYETTAAAAFQKLFEKYNGNPYTIEILAPERRINYKMPNKGWDSSAQMPTMWICFGLDIYKTRNDYFRTFYVPMRSVQYDKDNKEIQNGNNIRSTKQNK